ncbi:class A beta-lactamase-related serine hydrolase [Corallococcus exercitus]|uniref:serine hydrolase domain-containing protein n=1 Tax=Corallococcus exercitus TaxID=2316736 RepID=UPI000EA396A4|nr:serine hydrolase domain-containing protein [Corallococcus exercitus]RKG72110.1 class A beta-lactamase-related serine hydrolase [Corallococcus exercitus]
MFQRVALLLVVCLTSCGGKRVATGPGSPPDRLDDGWAVASFEDAGVQRPWFDALEHDVSEGTVEVPDAVLVARGGQLLYERYWNGFTREEAHDLRSATKSVTSLLVGMAHERGLLPDLDAPVLPLLPHLAPVRNPDPRKERITVRHLLQMRSGLSCDDWDPKSPGNEERMYDTDDWVRFIVDVPMRDEPGTVTRYCTGGVVLLGAVLEHVSGRSVADLSREWLFAPMQVQDVTWQRAGKQGTDTGGHLRLRPRDFLKVGQLMLDGVWQGERLTSEAWVAESGKALGPLGDAGYGLLWWTARFVINGTPVEVFFARGNGGQYVFVAPSLDLTAAFTGSHYNDEAGSALPLVLFGQYVLPAALGMERPGARGYREAQ